MNSKGRLAMKLTTFQDLYVAELQDMHNAEKQLIRALPKMAKTATDNELRDAFSEHLEQTRGHLERLDRILEGIGKRPGREKCEAMEGLIAEGQELVDKQPEPHILDAGLIVAAQKVEHYEIAGYGGLRTFALLLDREEDAELLQQTLDEEKLADELLTQIAESFVNQRAMFASGG
jgi:ferritin-like metal-binding protein YciE